MTHKIEILFTQIDPALLCMLNYSKIYHVFSMIDVMYVFQIVPEGLFVFNFSKLILHNSQSSNYLYFLMIKNAQNINISNNHLL